MTATASIHGRVAFEPRQHTTRNGEPMTTVRLAVDVTGRADSEDEKQTWWIDVLAFGRNAETLARVEKGQSVSAMGTVTRSIYTPQNGEPRDSWSLLADSVLTVRSARPGGKRSQQRPAQQRASQQFQQPAFNADIAQF